MTIEQRKAQFEAWRESRTAAPVTRFYLNAYLENIDEPVMLREARAHEALYAHMPLAWWPGMELAGLLTYREPVGFHYGGGTYVDDWFVNELAASDPRIVADAETVRMRAYQPANPTIYSEGELRSIENAAAMSTWFGGHMVIDYERILAIGLDGYAYDIARANAENPGREIFYEALDTMLSAIRLVAERYAMVCGGELAGVLRHIAHRPPETFHQALQLVWLLHVLNGADSFGRFDVYLEPFYRADMEAGRMDERRAEALLCDLILKVEADGAIQNMTLGGTDGDGNDLYTPLTLLVLRVTRLLGYKGPNLCLRVTPTMPQDIWTEALALIAAGSGLPALYNDRLYAASLARLGVPLAQARGYCFGGCSQVMLPGMCNFMNDIGMLNVAKVCELAMFGGRDPRTGMQVGPVTPDALHCETFGALRAVFETQLDYFIDLEVSIHNKELPYRAACEGYVMRTLFMRDCIVRGLNVNGGGARYNHTELELIGITNAADHLYAIKKAVYDDGRYTMENLVAALRADFAGYADMQAYLAGKLLKFGNDEEELDALRAGIARRAYERFNQSKTCLGGLFVPGEVVFTAHEACGRAVGATADGRRAGTVLADSAGASQGRDIKGPTALMNSVLKLPVADYLLTSVVLNLRFLPATFESARCSGAMQSLFTSFFTQGGMQLQINVCDAQMLREAQENPALFRSLVVRVGGYSDYFVRLSRALQDEIIQRTAQRV